MMTIVNLQWWAEQHQTSITVVYDWQSNLGLVWQQDGVLLIKHSCIKPAWSSEMTLVISVDQGKLYARACTRLKYKVHGLYTHWCHACAQKWNCNAKHHVKLCQWCNNLQLLVLSWQKFLAQVDVIVLLQDVHAAHVVDHGVLEVLSTSSVLAEQSADLLLNSS